MLKLFTIPAFVIFWFTSYSQVNIGIITDLPKSVQVEFLIDSLIHEIDKTTGVNQKVTSLSELQVYNISSESEAQTAYHKLKADLIVSIGGISTKALSKIPNLSKPVIGLGIVDHELQNIPYVNGRSGKDNFTYLLTSRDIIKEIESFRGIIDFQNLTIINDPNISKSIDPLKGLALIDSLENELDIKIQTIQAADDVETTIQNIGTPDAVYMALLLGKSEAYIKELSDYFIEHKIPSFSSLKQHVDYGILGSSSGDNSIQKVFRRLAIVADEIRSGENASENFVALNLSEEIFLNISTARKLDFSPPFEVILTVNLVGEDDTGMKTYSFNEIAEIALQSNFDLKISYKDIELSELDIRSNRSFILPYLSTGLTGVQINDERANAMLNSSERSLSLDFLLTQVIYSEEALAAIKISQYLKNAQAFQTEVDVLNVLLDTYGSYLNVLSAKTNLDIQRRNLENTKTNLELARIRVDVGSANNADLYRWESEVANATQSLIEAQASLLTVKLQLNNLLANTLNRDYKVKDIGLEDDLFRSFIESPVSNLITTPDDLHLASDFLVQESLEKNPNKKQLLENIKASERQLQLNKRLLYLPTVSLQAQASEILARGGAGSEEPDMDFPSIGNGLQDNTWSVAANLSYPLFTGLSRRADRQKSIVQLEQLEFSNNNLDQALELSIKSSTINLLSATTNLRYSKQSAESANQNFLLVQNNYKEGAVNITQVIDAQQAALNANLQAAISVYEYIFANLQLEYSVGFFSMFLTEEQAAEFNNRFLEFISNN